MHQYSHYDNFASSGKKEAPLGMRDFLGPASRPTVGNPQNWTNMVDKIDLQLKDYLQESAKLTDQLIKKNKQIQKEAKRRLREQEQTDSSEEEESQYVLVAPNSNSRFNALDARDQPIAIPVKPLLALNPRSRTLEKTHMLVADTSSKGKRCVQTPRSTRSHHDDNCCLARENQFSRKHPHQQSCDTDRRQFTYQPSRQYETQDSGCCAHKYQKPIPLFEQQTQLVTRGDGIYRLEPVIPQSILMPVSKVAPLVADTYPQSLREQYIKYRLEPGANQDGKDKKRDKAKGQARRNGKAARKRFDILSESVLTEEKSIVQDDDRDDGVSVSAKSGQTDLVKNNLVRKAKELKEKEKSLLKNVINSQNNMIREISQEAQNQIGERQALEDRIHFLEEEIERERNLKNQKEKEVQDKVAALQSQLDDAKQAKREIEYQREVELRALEIATNLQAQQSGKSKQKVSSRINLDNRRSTMASVDLSAMKEFGRSARSKSKTPRTTKKTADKVGKLIKGIIQTSLDELERRTRSKSPHAQRCCIPYAESRTVKKPSRSTREKAGTSMKLGSHSVDRQLDFLPDPRGRGSLVGSTRKAPVRSGSKFDLGRVALETGLFTTDSQQHLAEHKPPKRKLIRDNLVTALKKKARGAVIDSLAEMVVNKLRK